MNTNTDIRWVKRNDLDIEKWDACISRAGNGLIYAYSYYLDTLSRQWDALVWKDYEAVMPLTWNRKYGVHYLYQPFLAAQLGVFGTALAPELIGAFLSAVPQKFRYWDIYLNHQNLEATRAYPLYLRSNYVLDLRPGYEALSSRYRENTLRNIRRTWQAGCTLARGFDAEEVVQLAQQQMRAHTRDVEDNIRRFRVLYKLLEEKKMAVTYGIYSPAGALLSAAIFFFSHQRAYYILVGNHPNGRTLGASHALIDAFIQDHAGQDMILDFEGSDIRNLAFFYSSFGAKEEKFPGLRLNRLPFWLKWLKK